MMFQNPILYLPLKRNAIDFSRYNNTGTPYSITYSSGIGHSSAYFNGASYIDVGNPTSLHITGASTWAFWVKASNFNVDGDDIQIICKDTVSGTGRVWDIAIANVGGYNYVQMYMFNASTNGLQSTNYLRLNRWYHIVVTYTPSQSIKIYINGKLDAINATSIISSIRATNVNINIGGRTTGGSPNYLVGCLEEVMMFNRALSSSEVLNFFNSYQFQSTNLPYYKLSGTQWTGTLTDTISLSDNRWMTVGFHLAESIGLADNKSNATTQHQTDTISLGDLLKSTPHPLQVDILSLSDNHIQIATKKLTETLGLTDSHILAVAKLLTDSLSLSDSLSGLIIGALIGYLSDTISLTDSLHQTGHLTKADVLSLTDNLILTVVKHLADTLNITDNVNRLIALMGFLSDSISFSDTLIKSAHLTKTDILSFIDAHSIEVSKHLTETITFSDSFKLTVDLIKNETINLTDGLRVAAGILKQDNLALSDSVIGLLIIAYLFDANLLCSD